jgi:4-methyl-5(b-hydroxyethyl)-thiazole monophosphate biosynthesis
MIYIFFAQGFEEIEGLATVDVLRRAKLQVSIVGVGSKTITGSHGITVICDFDTDEVEPNQDIDAVILPGGMPGTTNLEKSQKVQEFIDYTYSKNKLICAICAAPIILGHKGILKGREAICFPGYEDDLLGARISKKFICKDDKIITAKGMGVSIEFGLEIAKYFVGETSAMKLRESLQCQ